MRFELSPDWWVDTGEWNVHILDVETGQSTKVESKGKFQHITKINFQIVMSAICSFFNGMCRIFLFYSVNFFLLFLLISVSHLLIFLQFWSSFLPWNLLTHSVRVLCVDLHLLVFKNNAALREQYLWAFWNYVHKYLLTLFKKIARTFRLKLKGTRGKLNFINICIRT